MTQDLKKLKEQVIVDPEEREFQAEGTASKKTLKWGCSSHAPEKARLVRMEWGECRRVRSESRDKVDGDNKSLCRPCVGFGLSDGGNHCRSEQRNDMTQLRFLKKHRCGSSTQVQGMFDLKPPKKIKT